MQLNADNLDEILQAYRELYPTIPLKEVYMFFDEVQMADDWQPFVRRVYEQECRHIYNELKSQGVSIGKNTLYDVIVQTESIYLFFSLTKYEPSLVKENTGDKKYYCIDNGLRSVLLNPQSEDNGKLLENAVFLYLRRTLRIQEELHYYKGKKECDFVVTKFDKVTRLIQVSYQMGDEETRKREIDGLLEAARATNCQELVIVTMETEAEWKEQDMLIRVLPAWKWMLG